MDHSEFLQKINAVKQLQHRPREALWEAYRLQKEIDPTGQENGDKAKANGGEDQLRQINVVIREISDLPAQQTQACRNAIRTLIDEPMTMTHLTPPPINLNAPMRFQTEWATVVDQALDEKRRQMESHLRTWSTLILNGVDPLDPRSKFYSPEDARIRDPELELWRDEYVETWRQNTRIALLNEGIEKVCNALWARAEKEAEDELVAPSIILESRFEAAIHVIDAYLGDTPEASKTKIIHDLQEKAQRLHKRKSTAAGIYTTALQEQKYKIALDHLHELMETSPHEKVPEIDYDGKATGKMLTLQEAEKDITEKAQKMARDKMEKYKVEIEKLLHQKNPIAARDYLNTNRVKIDDFLPNNFKIELDSLARNIAEKVQEYKTIQTRLEDARSNASQRPAQAWKTYESVQNDFPWAPRLDETRGLILDALKSRFANDRSLVDQAFEQRDWETFVQLVNTLRGYYQQDDPEITDRLNAIELLDQQRKNYRNRLDNAQKRLEQMQRTLEHGEIKKAASDLSEFEQEYIDILKDLPGFEPLKNAINAQSNEKAQVDAILALLTSDNLSAIAKQLDNWQHVDQLPEALQTALNQLDLHRIFLEGKQAQELFDFDRAKEYYQKIINTQGHPDAEKAREARRNILAQESMIGETQEQLDRAEELINQNEYIQAYTTLNSITTPPNNDSAHQQDILRSRLNRLWSTDIITRLQHFHSQPYLDVVVYEAGLQALSGPLAMHTERGHHQSQLEMQYKASIAKARITDVRARLEARKETLEDIQIIKQAIRELQEASEKAQQHTLNGYANTYLKAVDEAKKLRLELEVNNLKLQAQINQERSLPNFTDILEKVAAFFQNNPRDIDVMIWGAKLHGLAASLVSRAETREDHYQHMVSYARTAHYEDNNLQTQRLVKEAELGIRLAAKTILVENYLKNRDSLSYVHKAVTIWEQEIKPEIEGQAHFNQWWQDLRRKTIAELSEDAGEGRNEIEFNQLIPIGNILILDENHIRVRHLLDQLPNVGLRLADETDQHISPENFATGKRLSALNMSPRDRLQEQVRSIQTHQRHVNALADLCEQLYLTNPSRWKSDLAWQDAKDHAKESQGKLEAPVIQLQNFQNDYVVAHDKKATEMGVGHTHTVDEFLAVWKAHFAEHPAYQELRLWKEGDQKARQKLQAKLHHIQLNLDAQRWITANYAMQSLQNSQKNIAEALSNFGLEDDLTLTFNDKPFDEFGDIHKQVRIICERLAKTITHAQRVGAYDVLKEIMEDEVVALRRFMWDEQQEKQQRTAQKTSLRDISIAALKQVYGDTAIDTLRAVPPDQERELQEILGDDFETLKLAVAVEGQNDITEQHTMLFPVKLPPFSTYRTIVYELRDQGEFEAATALCNYALDGHMPEEFFPNGAANRIYPIWAQARNRISQETNTDIEAFILPLNSTAKILQEPIRINKPDASSSRTPEEGEIEQRYLTMININRDVSTIVKILNRLKSHTLQNVTALRNEFIELKNEVNASEKAWNDGYTDWKSAVAELAREMIKDKGSIQAVEKKGLGRRAKGKVRPYLEQANDAARRCRKACPQHSVLLYNMCDNHTVYRIARTATNFNPSCGSMLHRGSVS